MDYSLLFRWFVGLGVDDPVWDVTVFTKNRDRLLAGEIAAKFLRAVLAQPRVKALLSDELFSSVVPGFHAERARHGSDREVGLRRAAGHPSTALPSPPARC